MRPTVISLLARPPHPARDGGGIRNYHLLRALATAYDVKALSLLPRGAVELPWEAPPGVDLETVPLDESAFTAVVALARSFAGEPYTVARYRSAAFERRLQALAASVAPAWVVAHGFHMAPVALRSGSRAWIDLHNIESVIWRRTAATAEPAILRPAFQWQHRLVERMERGVLKGAGGLSVTSEPDAARALQIEPASTPVVVPNGVDLARYRRRESGSTDPVLLFVGDLRWRPNAQGVEWFCRSVWPRLRVRAPGARVEILGRGAPDGLLSYADDRLSFVGDVADTRTAWARAAVGIVPLLAGGGTRLKILEAAAMGVPVVSTTVGAEGLTLEAGREILIADDPDDWARDVARLLSDSVAAGQIADLAHARVEREYDWTAIGATFVDRMQASR